MRGRRRIPLGTLPGVPLAACLVAVVCGAVPPAARGQGLDLAGVGELEYSFTPAGARSLGMGSAFVGRADDATASYANPAGLVQLSRPEVSVEIRNQSFPGGGGFPTSTPEGLVPAEAVDGRATGVSFLSYVYPYKRWTLALYRYQLADYDIRRKGQGGTEVALFGHGLAGAYRFDNGLAVGAVLLRYQASLDRTEPCRTLEGPCEGTRRDRLDAGDVAANLGLLWQLGPRWSVGAVFRQGPTFEVTKVQPSPADPATEDTSRYALRIPDVIGVGVGVRPTSRLVLNLDWVRVRHSQTIAAGDPTIVLGSARLGEVRLDDIDEVHVGLEYSFWNLRGAPALRIGAWREPSSVPRFVAAGSPDPTPRPDGGPSDADVVAQLAERLPGGEDRLHLSAGFGFVFGRHFQLDAAADVSDETQTYSLSTLVRF